MKRITIIIFISTIILGIMLNTLDECFLQYNKRKSISLKLKKFIKTSNEAIFQAQKKYKVLNNIDEINFLTTYMKPYIKSSKIIKIKNEKGETEIFLQFQDDSTMKIKKQNCYIITYDINGANKPNELGRDIFAFILCRKSGTCNVASNQVRPYYCVPAGTPYPTHEEIMRNCQVDGQSCTILLQENQWEFPKDYPTRL